MYKQSPSRSHRSKGIKVKHILQICLLLAVCFWLIYQVKHSHEKRKDFDTKDGKIVGKMQADSEIQRFGRKDLPRVTELATDVEKHEEDEDEKEVEEEETKHEEDEPEKEDNKHEEEAGEGRGGGDDEIDDNETERTDTEPEHEEESVDEDKEREENEGASEENHIENEENEDIAKDDLPENEENEGSGKEEHTEPEEGEDVKREDHNDTDAATEDQDHDGVDADTHEAREEQYKADDASSEVAHEIQTIIPETGNLTTGQAGEIWGKVNFGQGNETQTPDNDDTLIQSGVQHREDMNQNVTSTTETGTEQKKYEIDSNKSEDSLLQNSTLPNHTNDQPENRSNSTDTGGEQSTSLLSKGTQMELPSSLSQNVTGEVAMHREERSSMSELAEMSSNTTENVNSYAGEVAMHGEEHTSNSESAEVSSNRTENVNSNAGETLNSGDTTLDPSHKTNGTDAIQVAEDSSLNPSEKSSNNGTSVSDESSKSHPSDESAGGIQHKLINTSQSESGVYSGTLPEIRTEVQSTDDTVAQ